MKKNIISHVRMTDMVCQSNDDHQRGVAEMLLQTKRPAHFSCE